MKRLRVLTAGLLLVCCSSLVFAQARMIDINTATAEQLEKGLKGIGPKKAADIVNYRDAHGPFQSVNDLARIPTIRGKTFNKIKPMITVGTAETPAATPSPAAPSSPTKGSTKSTAPTVAPSTIKGPANPTVPAVAPSTIKVPANPTVPNAPPTMKGPANPTVPAAPPTMGGPANPTVPAAPSKP